MDVRTGSKRDDEKTNLSKSYKGVEVVKSQDHTCPERTQGIEEDFMEHKLQGPNIPFREYFQIKLLFLKISIKASYIHYHYQDDILLVLKHCSSSPN